jgi:hypothetical protein
MRSLIGLGALAALVLATPADEKKAAAETTPTLEEALSQAAPKLLAAARERGIKNVGTLKILVGFADGQMRPSLGSLNYSLPDRLEVALILAQDAQAPEAEQVGVISRCTRTLGKTGRGGLDHRTKDGRAEFFTFKKTPFVFIPGDDKTPEENRGRAWGRQSNLTVPVDDKLMFLTGEATLSKDLRTLTIRFQGFHNKPGGEKLKLIDLGTVICAVEPRLLSEVGVSYDGSRSPLRAKREEEAKEEREKVVLNTVKYVPQKDDTPRQVGDKVKEALKLLEDDPPVKLEILYGGEPVKVGPNPLQPPTDTVLLAVPEPKEGQKVTFRLNNRRPERLGVLLRVNGQNTIFPDEDRDAEGFRCYKWVLDPMGGPRASIDVEGFQTSDKQRRDFEVRSEQDAVKEGLLTYTEATGTFQFEVYRPREGAGDALVLNTEDKRPEALTTIGRGAQFVSQQTRPGTLAALQAKLRENTKAALACRDSARGAVVAGKVGDNEVKRVGFNAFPDPYLSVTIRYFAPKK